MEKVLRYVFIGALALVLILGYALRVTLKSKKAIEAEWKNAVENAKSYSDLYSKSESNNRAFKLTIDQLKDSNDSIFQKLDETRKELKVKDSKLQSLQYVSSDFSKADTIYVPDTIFRDKNLSIDTLLYDDWYSLRVGLDYPSTISIKPEFKSEKHIVVSTRRETVNPPKKFFLLRWFQKKQTVLSVDVVEKNPYVQKQVNRYVEIVR